MILPQFCLSLLDRIFFNLKIGKYSKCMVFPLTVFCIVLRLKFSYTMVKYCQKGYMYGDHLFNRTPENDM